jgi:hypothetical protein
MVEKKDVISSSFFETCLAAGTYILFMYKLEMWEDTMNM